MQSNKYRYSTFNEMTKPSDYNFYGIIYDASFPLLEDKQDQNSQNSQSRYECTIKLIDKDINCLNNPKDLNDNVINLIIKSTNKESMPYIHSIGDIIRVHRGNYVHKKKRNVYLHLSNQKNARSSWVIFAGASAVDSTDTTPVLCSHENYTFEPIDTKIILSLRQWLKEKLILQNSLFYPLETKLNNRAMGEEYDATVLVVYKTELDDQIVYYVQDETDGCELHTFKYFKFIDKDDVLRLRGYKVLDRKVIIMNQYSNILKIPQYTWYYNSFMKRIDNKIRKDEMIQIENSNLNKTEPSFIDLNRNLIISPIQSSIPEIDLKHIDDFPPSSKYIYIEVMVVNISPEPIYNLINVLCPKCSSTFYTRDLEFERGNNIFFCPNCKSQVEGLLHYNAVLHCIENINANKVITLHLCSYDHQGETLLGIPPCDFYRDSTGFIALKAKIEKITTRDNYIRVLCEKINVNGEQCVYRVIGQYQNNNI